MTREQALGALLCIVCVLILVCYVAELVVIGWTGYQWSLLQWLLGLANIRVDPFYELIWLIAVPVAIAFCAVLVIGAWIGWTMATTPPPVPIESLEEELEEKAEEGEKKEAGAEEGEEKGE